MPGAPLTSHPAPQPLTRGAGREAVHAAGRRSPAPRPCGTHHETSHVCSGLNWLLTACKAGKKKEGDKKNLSLLTRMPHYSSSPTKDDQKNPFSSYFSISSHCLNCWFYPMETSAAEILRLKICTSQLPNGWSCLPIAARVDINCDFQFAECHILTLHRWRMQTEEVKSESLWLPDIPRKNVSCLKLQL